MKKRGYYCLIQKKAENGLFYGMIYYKKNVIEQTVGFINEHVAKVALNKRIEKFNQQFTEDVLDKVNT